MNFEMLLERAKAGDKEAREGGLLVVTELKRFGRNYGEIYKEWFHIKKEIGADIKVTSMPILDITQSKELVGQLITDVVLAVFAYMADRGQTQQVGLTEHHELQRQGIEVAKVDGKYLGRPKISSMCWHLGESLKPFCFSGRRISLRKSYCERLRRILT